MEDREIVVMEKRPRRAQFGFWTTVLIAVLIVVGAWIFTLDHTISNARAGANSHLEIANLLSESLRDEFVETKTQTEGAIEQINQHLEPIAQDLFKQQQAVEAVSSLIKEDIETRDAYAEEEGN